MTGSPAFDWERIDNPFQRLVQLSSSHPEPEVLLKTLSELRRELDQMRSEWTALERAALEDPLTGVGNRRGFEFEFRRAFSAAVRYQQPLSLMLIDVNSFKQINDRYGHVAGDQVLRRIGRIMHDVMRTADYVARYGGDEFVAILPNTLLKGAELLGGRLQRELNHPLLWNNPEAGDVVIEVSVGIGLAMLQETDQSEWDLFHRCDAALIRAKQSVKQG